jgi:pimeloyl-ACP methyl ester carboxylesterase
MQDKVRLRQVRNQLLRQGAGAARYVRVGEDDGQEAQWPTQYLSEISRNKLPLLVAAPRLAALHNRVHGISKKPLEEESYTDERLRADDVAAVISALDLDRLVPVGGLTAASSSPTTCAPRRGRTLT